MTVEEIITRYEHNAEYERTHGNLQGCLEFRQIADWLKDYKRQKEAWEKVKEDIAWSGDWGSKRALEIIDKHLKEVEK